MVSITEWSSNAQKAIYAFIDQIEDSIKLVTNSIISAIDFYQTVPIQELEDSVRVAITTMVNAFLEMRELNDEEKELLSQWAEERAIRGVPLEIMMSAVRDGIYIFWDEILRFAQQEGVSAEEEFQLGQIIWSGANELSYPIVAGYHRAHERDVRVDQQKRDTLLRSILIGNDDSDDILAHIEHFGLSTTEEYFAFRARSYSSTPQDERLFDRAINDLCTIGPFVASTTMGSDVAGLSQKLPMQIPPSGVIGIEGPTTLENIPAVFKKASDALHTAYAFGKKGVYTAGSLGLLTAVVNETNVGDWAVSRYLHPIGLAGSSAGSIRLALKVLIDHDMKLDEVAKLLNVHPNTLRYRLKRFEKLTNSSLDSIEDMVGIWWALQFSEMQKQGK
jgi:hypothetical protein